MRNFLLGILTGVLLTCGAYCVGGAVNEYVAMRGQIAQLQTGQRLMADEIVKIEKVLIAMSDGDN